jgi:hypothetical protein
MKKELTITVAVMTMFIIGIFFGMKLQQRQFILNYPSPEYQFVVTDSLISVSDFGREVGTVKIEGQLKQLIDKDNL